LLGWTFLCPLRRENTEETSTCRTGREGGWKDENDSKKCLARDENEVEKLITSSGFSGLMKQLQQG
jgi:hypothetical protein